MLQQATIVNNDSGVVRLVNMSLCECPCFVTSEEFESIKKFLKAFHVRVFTDRIHKPKGRNIPRIIGVHHVYCAWVVFNDVLSLPVDVFRFSACLKLMNVMFINNMLVNMLIPCNALTMGCFDVRDTPCGFDRRVGVFLMQQDKAKEILTNQKN